jgi:CRISPR/Cas system CSM-associated protein Csm3 (group 7 of RAMP superfamily)
VNVSSVCTDVQGQAFIPASTIKGVLVAWLRGHQITGAEVNKVFGETSGDEPIQGGKAEFHDARLTVKPALGANSFQDPDPLHDPKKIRRHWSASRGTCVEARVAIDPRTKTADDQKLYHLEYVPEGSEFEIVVNLPMASEAELLLLLRALAAFSLEPHGARIGAEQANGWGKVQWGLTRVEKIDAADIAAWIQGTDLSKLPFAAHPEQVDALAARALARYPGGTRVDRLEIDIVLRFQGALLVNDPTQERKGDSPIGHATLLRQDGIRYYLPGSSVRGAFRGQAARIWRTIAQDKNVGVAPGMTEVKDIRALSGLLPFLQLFGAPGWRTPLAISDFEISDVRPHLQEFVAIDRFTGGSSDKKKFSARGLYKPVASGKLSIDLTRLCKACTADWTWAMMLLLFTLRDLVEGDINFGFGAGKGYGHCLAEVTFHPSGDDAVDTVLRGFPFQRPADPTVKASLEQWYECLEEKILVAKLPDHVQVQQRGT